MARNLSVNDKRDITLGPGKLYVGPVGTTVDWKTIDSNSLFTNIGAVVEDMVLTTSKEILDVKTNELVSKLESFGAKRKE